MKLIRIRKLILLTTLMGFVAFLNSCKDNFLVNEPPGSASESVMTTSTGVESLLIGAYDMLTGDGYFGGAMATDWTYGSGASDDTYKGTTFGDQSSFNQVERYNTNPANPYMAGRWRDSYNGVSRANDVLTNLRKAQESNDPIAEERAKEIEGEAKFLRAWFHFKATLVFEKIPYIKTAEELGDVAPEKVPNDSEGWDGIEADLQFAIDNLPEESPKGQPGRADKWAALALKAKAHMYQNEFDQAKPLLDQIIDSGQFELVDNYFDNYRQDTENNVESIFEIQASVQTGVQNNIIMAGPASHQKGPAGVGWGFFQPSQDLFEAFQTTEDGLPVLEKADRDPLANDMGMGSDEEFVPTDHELDPRVDWTIARRGVDYLGWGIHPGEAWIRAQSNGGPYMTKKFFYLQEFSDNTADGGFDNPRNFRAIRYGHVLLWRAEIAVEDGNLEYARELVNMIRNRAKNSDYVMGRVTDYTLDSQPAEEDINRDEPAANYEVEPYPVGSAAFSSQENARKAVRLEHRLEFATEGLRFFQLRRWGIADRVLNNYIQSDSQFRNFMQGASYDPQRDDYWPIPQSQIDIQSDVLTQDESY